MRGTSCTIQRLWSAHGMRRAQILHYTTLRDVNIYQVQCLTLMAAFQASVNAMPMSWLLAGQALRVAQDLGLHVRCSSLSVLSSLTFACSDQRHG
jgi:hypothetical protein